MFGKERNKYRNFSDEELSARHTFLLEMYRKNKSPEIWEELTEVKNEMDRRFYEKQEKYAKEHPDWMKNAYHREHGGLLKDD